MLRAYAKYLWIVAVVALFLTVGASTSQAFHHHGCRCAACCLTVVDPCCSPVLPAYSVAYSPCCPTFDCALGIRPGPVRRAVFGPYRWYCGYNLGVTGVYAGWAPSVAAPCCQPTPANGTLTPTPATPTPAAPQTPPPAAAPTGPVTPKATSVERQDAGQITIWVPENAKVYVNGLETKSTGNLRQFVSYGLKPGMAYNYTIRAVVVRDGRSIEESHSIKLVAGQRSAVAFNFNSPANSSLASVW